MTDPKTEILRRVFFVYAVMLIVAIVIVGKIIYIQTVLKDELLNKAEQQEIKVFGIEAMRGNILSADGSLLATTVPVFEVRMDVASNLISDETFNTKVDSLSEG